MEVMKPNDFTGYLNSDGEMIIDRPLKSSWFVPEGSNALKLSKLLLNMYAQSTSSKSMYPDRRPSPPESMNDFESLPRSRRSVLPNVTSTIELAMEFQTHKEEVKNRLNQILTAYPNMQFLNFEDNDEVFDNMVNFYDDSYSPDVTGWKRECPECLDDHDARKFDDLFDVESFDSFLDPKDLNFSIIPEMEKRQSMTTTLPTGNNFTTKSWYDLNIFEKFGYLPDYDGSSKLDSIDIFSGEKAYNLNVDKNDPQKKVKWLGHR